VRWFHCVPSPVKKQAMSDMIHFARTFRRHLCRVRNSRLAPPEASRSFQFLQEEMLRYQDSLTTCAVCVKPVSQESYQASVQKRCSTPWTNDRDRSTIPSTKATSFEVHRRLPSKEVGYEGCSVDGVCLARSLPRRWPMGLQFQESAYCKKNIGVKDVIVMRCLQQILVASGRFTT